MVEPVAPARMALAYNHSASATLGRCIQAMVLNTVIALGITLLGEGEFGSHLVYSQCIGLSMWALIDLGHRALMPDPTLHRQRIFWIAPLGAVLGYLLGTLVADTLLGLNGLAYWSRAPRKAIGFLALSLFIATLCTYYFMSRALLASAREDHALADAQAQAAQRQAAESQLKLLQTQLEPHMLFNTLANLRALMAVDPARAQDMLDHLVAYLRATLDASRATSHTLQAEFDRLQDYLALMAVRMGTRLRYTLELPSALAGHPVPPLLLQALVENSIQHGLEPKTEGGSIYILARRDNDQLILELCDTGVGCPADLNQASLREGSFGLAQVRARLQTSYGERGHLFFAPDPAGGTRVRITLPYTP